MKTSFLVVVSMCVGVVSALLVPPQFVLVPILVPFVGCIILAWYVAFQNKAVQFAPFRLFFWPWVDFTTPLRSSRTLLALYASAGLVAGGCLGLLIQVANA